MDDFSDSLWGLTIGVVIKRVNYCYERYFERQIMKNWPVMFYERLKEMS